MSFVGEDDSGSFGILPGHARVMTLLGFGLARFRVADRPGSILALAGGSRLFRRWSTLFEHQALFARARITRRLSAAAAAGASRRRRSLARNETEHAPAGRRNVQALVENAQERRSSPDDNARRFALGSEKLEEQVEKQARRIKQAEKDKRTLLGQTVYLGTLGLMFVLPVVGGAYLGQWLDSLSNGYEVHWTVSLIVLGVVVGGINVYLFVTRMTDGKHQRSFETVLFNLGSAADQRDGSDHLGGDADDLL